MLRCTERHAGSCAQSPVLQVLRLRGNPLGEESAEPLARAVLAGASLAELDVGSCQVRLRHCLLSLSLTH